MPKFVIVFLALLYSLFGIYSATQDITTTASTKNTEYTQYLTTAVHDAAKEMKQSVDGSVAMPDTTAREKVMNTFYNSLAMNFGYDTEEDMSRLRSYVPAVILIDNNGYYICYEHVVKENGKSYIKPVISEINTWAQTTKDGSILVRYYLGNNVDLTFLKDVTVNGTTYKKGQIVSGNFLDLYKQVDTTSNDDLTSLGFSSEAEFTKDKREYIIPDIQEKAEYYINNHNNITASLGTDYIFEMPTTSEDDWVRVLENPTCLAFLQGIQISNTKKYLNIYALGGGEVKKGSSVSYYDVEITNPDGTKTVTRKYYNADNEGDNNNQNGYFTSDIDAAKHGGEIDYEYEDDKNDPESDIFKNNIAKTIVYHPYYPVYKKSTGGTFVLDRNSTSGEQVGIRNQFFMDNGIYTEKAPASFQYNGITYTADTNKLGTFTEGRSSAKDKGGTKHVHTYPTYACGSETLTPTKEMVMNNPTLKAIFLGKDQEHQATTVPSRFTYNGKTYTVKAGSLGDYGTPHHHVHSVLCQTYIYHHYNTAGTNIITENTTWATQQQREYAKIYGPYSTVKAGSFTSALYDADLNSTLIGYTASDAKLDINYLAPSIKSQLVYFWDDDTKRQEAIDHYKNDDKYKYGTDTEKIELVEDYLKNKYYVLAKNDALSKLNDSYIKEGGVTKKFKDISQKLKDQLVDNYIETQHDSIVNQLTDSRQYRCGFNKGDIDYYALSCGLEEGAIENAQTEYTIDYYVQSNKYKDGEKITKKQNEKILKKLDEQGYPHD